MWNSWLNIGVCTISVSVLSVFAILTDPHISVFGNKIWASCSVPVIQFLVIVFPSVVVICLDSGSIFLIQVSKYFAVPVLIVLFTFYSIVLLAYIVFLMICSILLIVFGSIVSLLSILSFYSFIWKGSSNLPLSHILFLWVYTITTDVNFSTLLKCAVLYSGYAARLSGSLWKLWIKVGSLHVILLSQNWMTLKFILPDWW